MDSRSLNSQAENFESSSHVGPCCAFAYYHPQYQLECSVYQDDRYASFIFGDCDCLGESAYYASLTNLHTSFDASSVSPALCQGHADLPEFDDELDCPGELACDEYPESSTGEEDDGNDLHPPPPPSPYLAPSPSPSPSSESFRPPRASRIIRTIRTQSRYSPMESKAPSSRKGKSVIRWISRSSDDEEPKKPKKRREAVSLACYFCRKRKIACRQPPEGSLDRTCNQCKSRGTDCEFPTESRRGARRASGSATSQKPTH